MKDTEEYIIIAFYISNDAADELRDINQFSSISSFS